MKNNIEKRRNNFHDKAINLHGDKYDYSKTNYVNNYTKIVIICKKHGEFLQIPCSHLQGSGCDKCRIDGRKTSSVDFINQSNEIYDNKYNYSLVDYKTALLKVKIICPDHGVFEKTPNKHISRKQGCPKCGRRDAGIKKRGISTKYGGVRVTTEVFIEKAKKIHGNKYSYDLVNYLSSKEKVIITCKKHGDFYQVPDKHLIGNGCRKCGFDSISRRKMENPTGWTYYNWIESSKTSKNFDSFKVYVIKCWNDEEIFYKVGRTFQKIKVRFKGRREMPYNYEVLNQYTGEAREMCELETKLKNENAKHSYTPKLKFHGKSECFASIIKN